MNDFQKQSEHMNANGYKLLHPGLKAHNGFTYTVGVAVETSGAGGLCGPGWLHYYRHPLLAVLLDPMHGGFGQSAVLYEIRAEGAQLSDRGLKEGCTRLTLLREIPLPTVTTAQRARFAELCAKWAQESATGPRLSSDEIRAKLAELAEQAVEKTKP